MADPYPGPDGADGYGRPDAAQKRGDGVVAGDEDRHHQAITDHVLVDARIDAEEAAWLRRMVYTDGKIRDEERKLLHELRGKAGQVSREFEVLFDEGLKQPQERHTCG